MKSQGRFALMGIAPVLALLISSETAMATACGEAPKTEPVSSSPAARSPEKATGSERDASPASPEGLGLSARYPGDRGIASDPNVLFAEDFETGTIAEISKRWNEASNKGDRVISTETDASATSPGRRSLAFTSTLGEDTGGHLYTRLRREVEEVYARFYVKFPSGGGPIHHFVHLGGYRPATGYPQGGAGERPRGDERITVGIEPWCSYGRFAPPGAWNFYAYWAEMKISADGRYWGNGLSPAEPAMIPKDAWQCVEVRLKLNSTPDARDGELTLWIDGQVVAHFARGVERGPWTGMGFTLREGGEPFEGFRFRASAELKINFFWLLHYVTENAARQSKIADPPRTTKVLFDDIVVATRYIGPIAPKEAKASQTPASPTK